MALYGGIKKYRHLIGYETTPNEKISRTKMACKLVEKYGYTYGSALKAIDVVYNQIREELFNNNAVYINGVGLVKLRKFKETVYYDREKKGVLPVPERFKPSIEPAEKFWKKHLKYNGLEKS